MNKLLLFLLMATSFSPLFSQEKLDYQKPPEEILELVEAPLAPSILIDREARKIVMIYRDKFKDIADLSQEEMRLAGLRINPTKNIGSRTTFFNNIKIKHLTDKTPVQVSGLPASPRLSDFTWSGNQKYIAMLNTTDTGVELWLVDTDNAKSRKLTDNIINASLGDAISWFPDNSGLLVKTIPSGRKELIDVEESIPRGPVISTSKGEKAQNRTYQDLLENPDDEFNFEQLTSSDMYRVDLDGNKELILSPAMYSQTSFSPDGNYILITRIKRPFSYLVPYYRFPSETTIYDKRGEKIKTISEVPLIEVLPQGFDAVRTGRRAIRWRSDKPATIYWAEALDKGDPEEEAEYRDAVYQLKAPFDGNPAPLLKTINRFRGITWGDDETAIAYDLWWKTRNVKTYLFNPSDEEIDAKLIFNRNYQDRYSDPGSFVTKPNEYNRYVLTKLKGNLFLMGEGYSDKGQFPFVDELDLSTMETLRLYQSSYKSKLERLYYALDMKKGNILVRIESKNEYPNYYIRNIKKDKELIPVTNFENPFKSIQDVHKEVISYKRKDGLALNATLYLPVGYDMREKEKKPMLMWAYPREYKDRNSASQLTANPNSFTYPHYGSPVFWVTQGYVVLDDVAFPVIGEGEEEPNDSFREQLIANASAAIDAVNELGYIDPEKVAVGGHSYGAFMVANLVTHSDLFAAGIARSGAYNRTLTPFGFQSEERTYWEAPEVYNNMSPFMHADKMNTPLLLIHGEADNNSGTYPMQSERYFNALKGHGATVRLVILPKESHGYAAEENILHLLWEQHRWLEKYVKKIDAESSIREEKDMMLHR